MGGLMGWLASAVNAEADARHLRELYGPRAEAWCAGALGALAPGDPRRRSIRLIAKALRGLPVSDESRALSSPSTRFAEPGSLPRR